MSITKVRKTSYVAGHKISLSEVANETSNLPQGDSFNESHSTGHINCMSDILSNTPVESPTVVRRTSHTADHINPQCNTSPKTPNMSQVNISLFSLNKIH